MTSFNELVSQGSAHAWLFLPSAILLGALHGLEPGHSKTMMAAFVIAVRGTIFQAILLGLAAAFSHSLIIWGLAAFALHYGSHLNAETTEPYFQIVSGILILAMAGWMFWRTRRDQIAAGHHHSHGNEGPHGGKLLNTGHGWVEISVFETNVPPRFRLYFFNQAKEPQAPETPEHIAVETSRPDGTKQSFTFVSKTEFLEASDELPEPHEFGAILHIGHGDHTHAHPFNFSESDHHHSHGEAGTDAEFEDAHQRAHAAEIERRFTDRTVTTPQIVLFGLTGGLMPCPAAFTVLLVCLQLKKITLGFTLVLCFSFGLAITMVSAGVLAAWGVKHASRRLKGFGEFSRKAPYVSSAVLIALGIFMTYQGWHHLP